MRFLDSLSTRDRRALIIGAAIALPVIGYLAAVRPYLRSEAVAREAVIAQRELLAREEELVNHAAQIPPRLATASAVVRLVSSRLYDAREPIAATAALARDVRRALDGAHVAAQRIESRDATTASNGLRELTVELHAEGDLQGIMGALSTLERGDKLIRVRRLSLDRSATGPGPTTLAWTATIQGYAR
jgi:hypothetical protein